MIAKAQNVPSEPIDWETEKEKNVYCFLLNVIEWWNNALEFGHSTEYISAKNRFQFWTFHGIHIYFIYSYRNDNVLANWWYEWVFVINISKWLKASFLMDCDLRHIHSSAKNRVLLVAQLFSFCFHFSHFIVSSFESH